MTSTPEPRPTPTALQRRAALFALFILPGTAISSWVTRTPAIRDLLGASTAEMGVVLFGLSVGSMAGVLLSGRLVARFGTRPVIVAGLIGILASMPVVGLGASLGSAPLVAAGLFLFGGGMGTAEIALNVDGADVERLLDRPVLPTMHGFFSLGTVIGAVLGLLLTAVDFSVPAHLVGVTVVETVVFLVAVRFIPAGTGRRVDALSPDQVKPTRFSPFTDRRLLLIAVVILAMSFTEGSANDWLPLLMVDDHGFDAAWSSGIYAVFAASMAAGRFSGGFFLLRFGRAKVVGASAVAAGIGLALVIFVDSQPVVAAAVVLWGLGAALGFPVALSAAGDSPDHAAQRVSFVATAGYVAFLVGPPLLGVLGNDFGLRGALIVVLALIVLAVVCSPAVGQSRARPVEDDLIGATRR